MKEGVTNAIAAVAAALGDQPVLLVICVVLLVCHGLVALADALLTLRERFEERARKRLECKREVLKLKRPTE